MRLILGDCLDVLPTLEPVDAIVTDPPYGIAYQSARRTDKQSRFPVLAGDGAVDQAWFELARPLLRPISFLFCFCRWDTEHLFRQAIADAGLRVASQVIWDRGVHGLGDLTGQYAPMHDNAIFATAGNFEFPGKRPKSVYRIDRLPANELEHPTQKPLALMERIILDLTRPDDTVLDPFMGSGTTGVACAKLGRNFIGIERDEGYFKIAERRIADAQAQLALPLW